MLTLGFGASGAWGSRAISDRQAASVIETALQNGVRHFDTAGFYQDGRAEYRLGRALSDLLPALKINQDDIEISVKVGKRHVDGKLVPDATAEGLSATLDKSCERLNRERLDIVYLHGPSAAEISNLLPALEAERAAGRIRAIGICTDGANVAMAAAMPNIDILMARLNLFDQGHLSTFADAKAAGKRTVAIAPLGQALWRRDLFLPTRPSNMWYLARALMRNREAFFAAQRLKWIRSFPEWSPAQIAIAYLRQLEIIDVAVTTTTQPKHLQETVSALTKPVPAKLAERLQGVMCS